MFRTNLLLALAALSSTVEAQTLVGVHWDSGAIHEISTVDASITPMGFSAPRFLGDLTLAADGFLYGIRSGADPELVRIDGVSGVSLVVGPLGLPSVFEGALAISPAGIAYGFSVGTSTTPQLFQVDLATGAATGLVALSNPPHEINGAAFRSDGVLMALERVTNSLVTIDPATGAVSAMQVLTPYLGSVGGLTTIGGAGYFVRAGPGSAGPSTLWQVDLHTGAHVLVGDLGPIGWGTGFSGLAAVPAPPGTPFCFGYGTTLTCPCGNNTSLYQRAGCAHSQSAGGVLRVGGTASVSNDTLLLRGSSMSWSSALYLQGSATLGGGFGAHFGDGLRCAGGTIVRLGTKLNEGGRSQYPDSGDASVSVRGTVPAGATRHYQVWYRNAAAFCTPETFNLTNGVTVIWSN